MLDKVLNTPLFIYSVNESFHVFVDLNPNKNSIQASKDQNCIQYLFLSCK